MEAALADPPPLDNTFDRSRWPESKNLRLWRHRRPTRSSASLWHNQRRRIGLEQGSGERQGFFRDGITSRFQMIRQAWLVSVCGIHLPTIPEKEAGHEDTAIILVLDQANAEKPHERWLHLPLNRSYRQWIGAWDQASIIHKPNISLEMSPCVNSGSFLRGFTPAQVVEDHAALLTFLPRIGENSSAW